MRKLLTALLVSIAPVAAVAQTAEPSPSPPPGPEKSGYTFLQPTPVTLRRSYNTDRPSVTDSPFSIDAGAFQMETDAVNFTLDRNNVSRADVKVRTILFGQTNFKIGLNNWSDLQIFPQGYVEKRFSGRDAGGMRDRSGFGDTTIRLKLNLVGNDGGNFVLGLVGSVKIPTSTNGLGNHKFEPGLSVPFNYNLPAGFVLFGQTRIDLLKREDADGLRAQWSNPIGMFFPAILGKIVPYTEFYNAVSARRGYPWVGRAGVGVIYNVSANFSIDVNSYFGLTRSADDLNVFAGFGYRF